MKGKLRPSEGSLPGWRRSRRTRASGVVALRRHYARNGRAPLEPLANLRHVVLEVAQIVDDDRFERHRLRIADDAWDGVAGRRAAGRHVRKMQVEMGPERDQARPVGILITLRRNPVVLFVSRQLEAVGRLRAPEALMIVGG